MFSCLCQHISCGILRDLCTALQGKLLFCIVRICYSRERSARPIYCSCERTVHASEPSRREMWRSRLPPSWTLNCCHEHCAHSWRLIIWFCQVFVEIFCKLCICEPAPCNHRWTLQNMVKSVPNTMNQSWTLARPLHLW